MGYYRVTKDLEDLRIDGTPQIILKLEGYARQSRVRKFPFRTSRFFRLTAIATVLNKKVWRTFEEQRIFLDTLNPIDNFLSNMD